MTATVDLLGDTVSDLTVIARAGSDENRAALWQLECPQGHRFVRTGTEIRRRSRSGGRMYCPECLGKEAHVPKVAVPGVRALPMCSYCKRGDHKRDDCEAFKRSRATKHRRCPACSDLGHRRPATGCPGCGEPFVAEKLPTIADVMARPHHNRREVA
jgi:hypothetical protein